jgi:hypothetical protein
MKRVQNRYYCRLTGNNYLALFMYDEPISYWVLPVVNNYYSRINIYFKQFVYFAQGR